MAAKKLVYGRSSLIYPYPEAEAAEIEQNLFDFEESDVYFPNQQLPSSFEPKLPIPMLRSSKNPAEMVDPVGGGGRRNASAVGSLPVTVPDWPKILKHEYRFHEKLDIDDDEVPGSDGGDSRVPPHEYLARRRGASFSVHEGVGRTLKGRDLWRVRTAILKKTGFED